MLKSQVINFSFQPFTTAFYPIPKEARVSCHMPIITTIMHAFQASH